MNCVDLIRKRNAEQGRLNRLAGLNFEFRVLRETKKKSKWAIRAEGSHGPFDIVSMSKAGKLVLIACKRNGYFTPKERAVIRAYKEKAMLYEVIKLAYYISPKKYAMEIVR